MQLLFSSLLLTLGFDARVLTLENKTTAIHLCYFHPKAHQSNLRLQTLWGAPEGSKGA